MSLAPHSFPLSVENYLQMEAQSPLKHEYIDGEIYGMAGASHAPVTIAGNLFTLVPTVLPAPVN